MNLRRSRLLAAVAVTGVLLAAPAATASADTTQPQPVDRWKFAQASGTPLGSPDEGSAHAAAVLGAGASVDPGEALLPAAGFLRLDGTAAGYAEAPAAPLHADRSFTVTAWANVTDPTRDMTVFSQGTGTTSAVALRWHYLGVNPYGGGPLGEWQATVADSDSPTAARTTVAHTSNISVLENWAHLALVYDADASRLTLYVDGQRENQTCEPDSSFCTPHISSAASVRPFDAGPGLEFGRERADGAWGGYFAGSLDDVWVHQGVLSEARIGQLADYNVELDTPTGP
ncbi:LamG-like jellyroll fold domain-containing protein [Kitasatospora sp. NPDC056076]|uniref:LamG-like jellyroll fold domain-containing protein n=1 Tax=Kitasatospora sp. NPDC056076 TaxID=3345703 RepID=UPI0035D89A44